MNVIFSRLLLLLLPTFLRKGILKSFCSAVSTELQLRREDTDNYFTDLNYHIRVTPQTFSLEKILNDKCDNSLRRIHIGAPDRGVQFYFSNGGSSNMQYFSNGEFFMAQTAYIYDFFVFVPQEFYDNENMVNYISALLNKYKLLTKSFQIRPI